MCYDVCRMRCVMKDKLKIHIISASPRLNSGFSIVASNLAVGLRKLGHEVTYTGLQTAHQSEWYKGIEILPAQSFHMDDVTQTLLQINKIRPDIVIAVIQMDADFNEFTRLFHKTLVYTPVEGHNIPQKMAQDLLTVKMNGGEIVAQCEYGRKEMELALAGLNIPVIYHGYNDDIYKKLDLCKIENIKYCYFSTDTGMLEADPEILCEHGCYHCHVKDGIIDIKMDCIVRCPYYKEEHVTVLKYNEGEGKEGEGKAGKAEKVKAGRWGEYNIPVSGLTMITRGKFVFGFVGQNTGVRKRIERLIKAYSLMIKDNRQLKDRTILHLHTLPMAVNGVNLIKIIGELGLNDNVIFSYGTYRSSGWSDRALSILYNTFSVFVSATSSEGFSLGHLESMACGVPCISPDCSSMTELIGDGYRDSETARGLLVSTGEWQLIENGSYRFLVNEICMAMAMKRMYDDNKLRERFGKNASEWTKKYNWTNICDQWNKLLKSMK